MRRLNTLLLLVVSSSIAACSDDSGGAAATDTGTHDTAADTGTLDTSPDTGTLDTAPDAETIDSSADSSADSSSDTMLVDATEDSTAETSTDGAAETSSDAADSAADTNADADAADAAAETGGDAATTKTRVVWALQIGDGSAVVDKASAAILLAPVTVDYAAATLTGTIGTRLAAPATISLAISSSVGGLANSGDGKLVSFAAYRAAPGTPTISDSAPATTKRVGVTASATGAFVVTDLGVAANGSGKSIRSAYTNDGTKFWVAAEDMGVTYNDAGAVTSLAVANVRWLGAAGGQLFVSSGSGSGTLTGIGPGLTQVGTAFPTAATTFTKVNGPVTGASPYGFVTLDTDATAGFDTLLLCDTGSATKGLQKWRLEAGVWTLKATHLAGTTGGCQGVQAWLDGTDVIAIVSTGETPTNLVAVRDPLTSTTAIAAGVAIGAAPTNAVFKGIALAPTP